MRADKELEHPRRELRDMEMLSYTPNRSLKQRAHCIRRKAEFTSPKRDHKRKRARRAHRTGNRQPKQLPNFSLDLEARRKGETLKLHQEVSERRTEEEGKAPNLKAPDEGGLQRLQQNSEHLESSFRQAATKSFTRTTEPAISKRTFSLASSRTAPLFRPGELDTLKMERTRCPSLGGGGPERPWWPP